jgi:outer membrane protein
MKKRVLGAVIAGLFGAASFATNIGVVDIQGVFDQTPQGHATLMTLQSSVQPQVDALKAEQQKLQDDAAAFQKNSPTLSADDRKTQQDALMARQKAFQDKVSALTDSEHAKEKDAAQNFTDSLKASVAKAASKNNVDVVLTAEATPYFSDKTDITKDVVSAMQSMAKKS